MLDITSKAQLDRFILSIESRRATVSPDVLHREAQQVLDAVEKRLANANFDRDLKTAAAGAAIGGLIAGPIGVAVGGFLGKLASGEIVKAPADEVSLRNGLQLLRNLIFALQKEAKTLVQQVPQQQQEEQSDVQGTQEKTLHRAVPKGDLEQARTAIASGAAASGAPVVVTQEYVRIEEQNYLDRVLQRIDREITRRAVECQRWKDKARDDIDQDYSRAVAVQWAVDNARHTLSNLNMQRPSPYFGRVDFLEDGAPIDSAIYVGKFSLSDASEDGYLVHDWRAPICNLFYDGRTGRSGYTAPDGRISGEVRLKRQYEIESTKLLSIYQVYPAGEGLDSAQVTDEFLRSVLDRNAGTHMRQIVSSIQSEQNAAIRHGGSIVVIDGPAGSGKTAIALHRVAYLLYKYRASNLTSSEVLVLSPTRVFHDYISAVLPDLGETGVKEWLLPIFIAKTAATRLSDKWSVEAKIDRYELALSAGDPDHHTRSISSIFKSSAQFVRLIRKLADDKAAQVRKSLGSIECPRSWGRREPFLSKQQLTDLFDQHYINNSLCRTMKLVADEVSDRITRGIFRASRHTAFPEKQTLSSAVAKLRRIADLPADDAVKIYLHLFESPERLSRQCDRGTLSLRDARKICDSTADSLKSNSLTYEDGVAVLLLDILLSGNVRLDAVRHVLIDEAQDYSVVELALIRRLVPDTCAFTVLGDNNQRFDPFLGEAAIESPKTVFDGTVDFLKLSRSYRSSQEITDFAGRILAADFHVDNIRRSGKRPIVVRVPNGTAVSESVTDSIREFRRGGMKTIAIITCNMRSCEAIHQSIAADLEIEGTDFSLINAQSTKLSRGVIVLPAYLAKGLEFDGVIVPDAEASVYSSEELSRLLYCVCTRALHELHVLYQKELTPLIDRSSQNLYDRRGW